MAGPKMAGPSLESVTCDIVALLLLGNTVEPGSGARAVDVEVHDLSVLE